MKLLDNLHAEYMATGNPLIVWFAYVHARPALPGQVLQYFDEVSEALLAPPRGARPLPQHVAKALGFTQRGRGGAYQWMNAKVRQFARELLADMEGDGRTQGKRDAEVAKELRLHAREVRRIRRGKSR